MTDQKWQNKFRRMYDLAKYIEQDCEAYNATNDREYLKSIINEAGTVIGIASVLLESDTEVNQDWFTSLATKDKENLFKYISEKCRFQTIVKRLRGEAWKH